MLKLGSILLFITFTQIIAVLMGMLFFIKRNSELWLHSPPAITFVIFIEFCYSGYLIYRGFNEYKS